MAGKFLTESSQAALKSLVDGLSSITPNKNFGKAYFERVVASPARAKKRAVKRRSTAKKK